MKLLLIIDLQNAFINNKTKGLIKRIDSLRSSGEHDKIAFTRFVNGKQNPVYKMGWRGCMDYEEIMLCLEPNDDEAIFDKRTYSAFNRSLIDYLQDNSINEIYLCGLDIDCCVLMTAINLFENGYNVYILKEYVGCMQGDNIKNNALDLLRRNIGKERII